MAFRRKLPDTLGIYFHDIHYSRWGQLREVVGYFHERGYVFVGPDDLCGNDRRRKIFVSLDDNYRSWYEALEFFGDLRLRVTFYVNTLPIRDRASRSDLERYAKQLEISPENLETLNAAEIRALSEAGHEIGAHTHSHFVLTSLSEPAAKDEILRSKEILEDIIGKPVLHFSFPYGMRRFFTDGLREYCHEIGFRSIANATPGLQFAGHQPSEIQRTPWDFNRALRYNVSSLEIDGRLFERLTGRSAAS